MLLSSTDSRSTGEMGRGSDAETCGGWEESHCKEGFLAEEDLDDEDEGSKAEKWNILISSGSFPRRNIIRKCRKRGPPKGERAILVTYAQVVDRRCWALNMVSS